MAWYECKRHDFVSEQLLDEAIEGFQLAFPAKHFAGNHTIKLLLAHALITPDGITIDAEYQGNLHQTEGLFG